MKSVIMNDFNDLVAILALYRPGPMDNIPTYANNKNTNKKINYIDPILEKILTPTYGVIVYQEQIMQLVQEVASFSLGKADLFRRAISKKDSNKLISLKEDLKIVSPTARVRIESVFVTIRGHIKLFHVVTNVNTDSVARAGAAQGIATLKKV